MLVLAVLAGLLAMHGLSGTAAVSRSHQAMSTAMSSDIPVARGTHGVTPGTPAPAEPHHGPSANGHHPCLAAPAGGAPWLTPADTATRIEWPPLRAVPAAAARARDYRDPPDLIDLCVSRT